MSNPQLRHSDENSRKVFYILINIQRLQQKTIVRSFERTEFSLQIDGSEDATKMKFQGQGVGIPTGLEHENPI